MAKDVAVYEILHDINGVGVAADGTAIRRFRANKEGTREALAFAAANTCYGNPCKTPEPTIVPRRLAVRWGVA